MSDYESSCTGSKIRIIRTEFPQPRARLFAVNELSLVVLTLIQFRTRREIEERETPRSDAVFEAKLPKNYDLRAGTLVAKASDVSSTSASQHDIDSSWQLGGLRSWDFGELTRHEQALSMEHSTPTADNKTDLRLRMSGRTFPSTHAKAERSFKIA